MADIPLILARQTLSRELFGSSAIYQADTTDVKNVGRGAADVFQPRGKAGDVVNLATLQPGAGAIDAISTGSGDRPVLSSSLAWHRMESWNQGRRFITRKSMLDFASKMYYIRWTCQWQESEWVGGV